MEDFNLKKFLVENTLTTNSKTLKEADDDSTSKTIKVTRASDGYGRGGRIDVENISPELLEGLILALGMLKELAERDPDLLSEEEYGNIAYIAKQVEKITY